MGQDIEPRVVWRHTLYISFLMMIGFVIIDWVHFFVFGTKFTYIINPASPTATWDFFFYLFVFAGMAFLIGFLVNFETKDVVAAGILGPYLFLIVNGFIIHLLLLINPAYGSILIPNWQLIWGVNPDWSSILSQVQVSFLLLYLQGFILFLVLALPFILTLSFTGHAIREMMGWNFPR